VCPLLSASPLWYSTITLLFTLGRLSLLISSSIREREHDPLFSPSVVVAVLDGAWVRGKINGKQKKNSILKEEKTGYNLNENNKKINTNFQLNELATWTTKLQSMSMANKKKKRKKREKQTHLV
jgi:hypothetical protein